jgi:6-phosphogluconolactonase
VIEPTLVVVPDPSAAGRAAAATVADVLTRAVAARDRADIATTGGSTPAAMYRALAAPPLRERVPWAKTQVWFGDDRFVPRDHELSNLKPLDDALLRDGAAPLPSTNVHPFPVARTLAIGEDEAWCAAEYAAELHASGIAVADGWPVFDLVLLGVGPDGHVLSVFPYSAALASRSWAVAVPAPLHIEPHVPRVTLNPRVVTVAREVLVVATGANKASVLRDVLQGDRDETRLPAQLARRERATWILDEAAASGLDG